MRVAVGLPATIPGASGRLVIEWAARAEQGPFSSLGVLDRIRYDNLEPFTALAAASAVTSRIRLVTMIVIGPLRSAAVLAKQTATLHSLAPGRMTLGLAVGARADDYAATGADYRTRGRVLAEQLESLRRLWERPEINARDDRPGLLVGGASGVAFARMARWADGYVHGGGPPRAFAGAARKALAAWTDAGRPGRPQLWGQGYFALEGAASAGADYLRDYYSFTGPFAERVVEGNLTNPQAIAQFVRGYEEEGCDELVLFPTVASIEQLESLAGVLAEIGWGLEGGREAGHQSDLPGET